MKKWLFSIIISLSGGVFAQTFSLQECWDLSHENYPLLKSKNAVMQMAQAEMKNAESGWMPQIEFSGQATYQSDVPHIGDLGLDIPIEINIPEAPKDQYRVSLDVFQVLFDGGRIGAKSQLEHIKGDIEQLDIELQYQNLRSVVTELYFAVLKLKAQKLQLDYVKNDLQNRYDEAQVAYENGVILKSMLSALKVEQLRVEQQIVKIDYTQKSLLASLSLLTDKEIDEDDKLTVPNLSDLMNPFNRLEYEKFQLSSDLANQGIKLYKNDRMPILAAFGQVGYGNPGYNMLADEFDVFWMVGVKLKWTPWDWNQSKRNRTKYELQKNVINYQKESFVLSQKQENIKALTMTEQYLKIMEKDEEIIELQTEVVEDYKNRLQSGVVTSADYIKELNTVARVRLDKDLNELSYLESLAKQQQVGVIVE